LVTPAVTPEDMVILWFSPLTCDIRY
jgi:hypothetical protein